MKPQKFSINDILTREPPTKKTVVFKEDTNVTLLGEHSLILIIKYFVDNIIHVYYKGSIREYVKYRWAAQEIKYINKFCVVE